jgi:hypothetical protein
MKEWLKPKRKGMVAYQWSMKIVMITNNYGKICLKIKPRVQEFRKINQLILVRVRFYYKIALPNPKVE